MDGQRLEWAASLPDLPFEQYRALIEASPVLIWRSGRDGEFDYFNETWLRFTGRSLAQELGGGWIEGVHPEDLSGWLATCQEHVARHQPFEMEYRLRRHDGVYRYVLAKGVPFYDAGRLRGFIGSCTDVHERHQAEEARDTFLRIVGHEFRTPLQSLSMFIEILRRQSERGQKAPPETLSKARSQLDRLTRLVGDLIDASRVGRLPLSVAPLDLQELVGSVVRNHSLGLESANELLARHTILFENENRAFPVDGDRARLQQAFGNILDNAVRYSPRGGTIAVTMRSHNGGHSVSISDPGIGIPPQDLESVGRRFFRASNASANHFPGLGVGLALAREIIEGLGGTVRIESRVGKGTRVTVTLPDRETEEA
jgi:PAS domain S-box-containing protein